MVTSIQSTKLSSGLSLLLAMAAAAAVVVVGAASGRFGSATVSLHACATSCCP